MKVILVFGILLVLVSGQSTGDDHNWNPTNSSPSSSESIGLERGNQESNENGNNWEESGALSNVTTSSSRFRRVV